MSEAKKKIALSGGVASENAICTVSKEGVGLTYRGYSIEDLAAKASYEETAWLVLHGDLPNRTQFGEFRSQLIALCELPVKLRSALELIPAGAHPMDVLRTGCSVLGSLEPEDTAHDGLAVALRLLATFPGMLLYWHHFAHEGPAAHPAADPRAKPGAERGAFGRAHRAIDAAERSARAGYDAHKPRKGSKVHIAVDTLGHLLALRVTSADQQERHQVEALAAQVQELTGETVELAYVDQGYTGQDAAEAAATHTASSWKSSSSPRPKAALACGVSQCAPAAAMGRRTFLRMDGAGPPPRPRLRTAPANFRRPPLAGLPHPHARFALPLKCMTRSTPDAVIRLPAKKSSDHAGWFEKVLETLN